MGKSSEPGFAENELLFLAEVARLYYIEDLTQEQIAQRVGGSRSNVSRMLKEARDRGLVEIRINSPLRTVPGLQEELKARLGLRDCLVLDSGGGTRDLDVADTRGRIGALTMRYLQETITDGSVVGVGWSRTVYNGVDERYLRKKRDVTVVQMMGSVGGSIPQLDGISITARLAGALGARAHYLHAPMLVADATVRNGLLRDRNIWRTLKAARQADIIIIGVGAIDRDHGQYLTGYLDDNDLEYIRRSGAVGDSCGAYFARDGSHIPLEMNERSIATEYEDLIRIPKRICASFGPNKALANVGAVRSKLINTLITDEPTAVDMLNLLGEETNLVATEASTS
ncbi:MAG: sugar-binding transcriptional regulator [Rubrobacteraceae bacterium]